MNKRLDFARGREVGARADPPRPTRTSGTSGLHTRGGPLAGGPQGGSMKVELSPQELKALLLLLEEHLYYGWIEQDREGV